MGARAGNAWLPEWGKCGEKGGGEAQRVRAKSGHLWGKGGVHAWARAGQDEWLQEWGKGKARRVRTRAGHMWGKSEVCVGSKGGEHVGGTSWRGTKSKGKGKVRVVGGPNSLKWGAQIFTKFCDEEEKKS